MLLCCFKIAKVNHDLFHCGTNSRAKLNLLLHWCMHAYEGPLTTLIDKISLYFQARETFELYLRKTANIPTSYSTV